MLDLACSCSEWRVGGGGVDAANLNAAFPSVSVASLYVLSVALLSVPVLRADGQVTETAPRVG